MSDATGFSATEVWINKADITQTKAVNKKIDVADLCDGEAIMRIDHVGFSANNISYALTGDKMGYWGFFPADEHWGIVPMWGFATVVASRHPDVSKGEKVYGYLPMATHFVVKPEKANTFGFMDAHPQRKSNSPVYDNYLRCATDPAYQQDGEAWLANYRPLFMTSFVLDDFVGEHITAQTGAVLLTSASSKTAYGCAHLLVKNKAERAANYKVVGLTSAANKAFTESLGCYDEVVVYDDINQLENTQSWVLDFAGNKQLLLDLQAQLGDLLVQELFIGATDVKSQANKPKGKLRGELFFAPHQVKKRTAEWGREGFNDKYATAWSSFNAHIQPKIEVVNYEGVDAVIGLYQKGLANKLDNTQINFVSF